MAKRFWVAVAALLVLAVECARPAPTPAPPQLKWTGKTLEGLRFTVKMEQGAVLHHAGSAESEEAGRVLTGAAAAVSQQVRFGRADRFSRVSVWLVPAGMTWPAGLPAPPPGSDFRAAAPLHVVGRAEGKAGLDSAVALALTQSGGSAALQADWLHEGMGAVLAQGWENFPLKFWRPDKEQAALLAAEAMRSLSRETAGSEPWRQAAAALSALVMERWGVNWTASYARPDLTPSGALLWATGADNEGTGTRRWQERMDYMLAQRYERLPMVNAGPETFVTTAADISPVRMAPALSKLPPGPGPMANFSPHAYTITAKYEPAERTVTGDLLMTWQNGEQVPVDSLWFNLWPNAEQYARYGGGIAIQDVEVDGKKARFVAEGLDLRVDLGAPVPHGGKAAVRIRFATRLPARITVRVFGQQGDQRFNLAHWFPVLAVLDDRGWNLHPLPTAIGEPYAESADYDVTLDVPAGTQVAATGRRAPRQEQDGRWIYRFEAQGVRDWAATGGRNLAETVVQHGNVTIRSIDQNPAWADAVAEETLRAFPLFEERFGPYGYPELVVTCCAGLEYPGLFYGTPLNASGLWKVVIYHELAHQWFFAMVGNDQYGEPWLDEGFARYGERLAVRAFGPAERLGVLTSGGLPSGLRVSSSTRAYTVLGNYGLGAYNKGALVLEDLEARLGAESFERLLRTWVDRYRFGTATTADFIRVAEEVSGRSLAEFFRRHGIEAGDRAPYRPLLPLGAAKPAL